MKYYFAPMEGITDYTYRSAHHTFFPGADKYFTPFIATNQNGTYKPRDMHGILPEHNQGMTVVPQILTNKADQFIKAANAFKIYGYEEINLNLGCPSKTVVTKYKGSGFLAKTAELDLFLEEIFSKTEQKISIKTRIGKEDPEEFEELLTIYNKYPLEELIIHPRVQTDYYKNKPNLEVFGTAMEKSVRPLCYNGDIFTLSDYRIFMERFPRVDCIMLGRGLISNPGLINDIKSGNAVPDRLAWKAFHDRIYEDYQNLLYGEKNVLFRMKEIWSHLLLSFPDEGKYGKKIRKSEHLYDYEQAVAGLFEGSE